MSSHGAPPRLTLDISTPPPRSSSLFSVSSLPDLVPPPPAPAKPRTSRNNLFDQDWSPITPNIRSRSSTAESQFSSTDESSTPSPASSGRKSWMDVKDNVVIVNDASTPIPGHHGREFNWPLTPPPSITAKTTFPSRPPPPPLPIVTFPPSPTSPSHSTFSPRPPLSPSSSKSSVLPPTAGHSDNPLLDTRQAPSLRLSPTSSYLLGEGRHASVYLASFSPRSPSPSPSRQAPAGPTPSPKRQLCAAKRLFPDRESQLSGLGEAFILSKLTAPGRTPSLERRNSSDSLEERGRKHILKLHGVKDERDGLESPRSTTLDRSDSRRSTKRASGGAITFAGSPLRGTGVESPASPSSPTTPSPPSSNKIPPPGAANSATEVGRSPVRPHHVSRKSLLPSLAPPLASSSAQRYKSQHPSPETPQKMTLAPSPFPSTSPPSTRPISPASATSTTTAVEPRIDLILEFCPFGNLLQFARNQPERMNRARWFQWSRELVAAVALCHERGILHADIKPQNIMIAPDLTTRLCDFGMSLFLPPPGSPTSQFPTDPHGLGTPTYSPPEFVRPLPSTFGYASDVFSLGVTLGVMISAREPFEGVRAVERMVLVGNGAWSDWEERKRLQDLEEDGEFGVDVEDTAASASLYNLTSLGGTGGTPEDRLSRQGSLRSLRSDKGSLRRSVRSRTSLRRSGSSDSLRSLASLGAGRDWEAIIASLLVEPEAEVARDGDDSMATSQLSDFALPPLPASAAPSPTHSRSTSLTTSLDDLSIFSRTYSGTSTPVQTFLDGVSVVPLEIRSLLRRMTDPREGLRPTAKEVLAELDELAVKFRCE
ncbi:hypothetical protein JCM11491_005290 [Sporobolomyces phaffii]